MFKKIAFIITAFLFPLLPPSGVFASSPSENIHFQVVEVDSWVDKWAESDVDVRTLYASFEESLAKGVEEGKFTQDDVREIRRAVAFAAEKHAGQFRKNAKKTPYIIHPIGVADYVLRIGGVYDRDIVIGALLHDVVNETGGGIEEIGAEFGSVVRGYVQEMSDDPTLSPKEQRKRQIVRAFEQSEGASVIKLADKLHNLRTLLKDPSKGWDQERLDGYFQWVQAVADNLPDVNQPLKEEMHKTITGYWKAQETPN